MMNTDDALRFVGALVVDDAGLRLDPHVAAAARQEAIALAPHLTLAEHCNSTQANTRQFTSTA